MGSAITRQATWLAQGVKGTSAAFCERCGLSHLIPTQPRGSVCTCLSFSLRLVWIGYIQTRRKECQQTSSTGTPRQIAAPCTYQPMHNHPNTKPCKRTNQPRFELSRVHDVLATDKVQVQRMQSALMRRPSVPEFAAVPHGQAMYVMGLIKSKLPQAL